jgi:hypothetical protein
MQHFNAEVFALKQKEYASEKIDVAHVSYTDNQPSLDPIEIGKQSIARGVQSIRAMAAVSCSMREFRVLRARFCFKFHRISTAVAVV